MACRRVWRVIDIGVCKQTKGGVATDDADYGGYRISKITSVNHGLSGFGGCVDFSKGPRKKPLGLQI